MSAFRFSMGKVGSVTFTQNEKGHLVMTAQYLGQEYALEFLDSVALDNQQLFRSETTRVKETFCDATAFTAEDNTLLAVTEIDPGVKICNRFTVSREAAAVAMDTWVQAEKKVYDAFMIVARTKMDSSAFTEIGGGDAPCFFPVDPCPPSYGFKGHMILRGENRYIKTEGGFLWHDHGMIDAHFQTPTFNDDITYFDRENPLKTIYSFEETPNAETVCVAACGKLEKTGQLISGELSADYLQSADGVAFVCKGKAYPMVAMLVRNIATGKRQHLDTMAGWKTVTVTENGDTTEFLFMDNGALAGVGLRIVGEKCPDSRIQWTVEVINQSKEYTVLWCSYVRLNYAPDGVCDLFHPFGGGDVEVGFNRTDGFKGSLYPAGLSYSMAYYAAWPTGRKDGKGIYYAVHDETGAYKDLSVCADSRGGQLRFTYKYCAENLGEPENGFTLPGKTVWQVFTGDWFDATELYRQFAETCDWMPPLNENGREDIPLWMRDLPFWTMDWIPNESDAEEPIPISLRPNTEAYGEDCWFEIPIKLREELGVPFGYHLYNWHGNPFNNDFPHFFPPKKALSKGLGKLQAADIRIMPYINALLWDNHDRGNEDWQFTSVAKPSTVKLESGEPAIETYASHESDGKLVRLSPMCPNTPVWREKLKEIVGRLFNELNVDGVYLDQTAAHGPHPCMAKNHGHKPGGGSWWSQNSRQMLRELNAIKPADRIFTSEGTGEMFAGELDGLLSWAWISCEKYVPAFMRIYGGRVMVLGRNANGYMKDTPVYWKYHLAQSLVAGEQMGWINADFVYNQQRLNFARKLIRFRYENRAFFRGARAMRPPEVEADESHKFACGIGMQWQGVLHEPYLCVGALENGRKKMFICVNLHTEEVSDKVWFKGAELGLQAENFSVGGEGSAEYMDENHLRLTVPGESLLCITWEVAE